MKDVDKAQFAAFLKSYPRPLTVDVVGIGEPPARQWNDFTLGAWPESVVASESLYESYPKDGKEPYRWSENTYRIKG